MEKRTLEELLSVSNDMTEFNEALKSFTENKITVDKRVSDLADILFTQNDFELEYNERKANAPDWPNAIRDFISEFDYTNKQFGPSFAHRGFKYSTSGKNPYLYELVELFVYGPYIKTTPKSTFEKYGYTEISMGYRMGLNFHKLMKELELGESKFTQRNIDVNNKKLVLKCTPGQFGAIIEMLTVRGYIEEMGNATATAKILLKAFEFENYPSNSFESLAKKIFGKTVIINTADHNEISNGKIPFRKNLKGIK